MPRSSTSSCSRVVLVAGSSSRGGTSRGRTSRCSRSRSIALLLLTAGLGILLGAINVYLRDTQHFLELALLAWFWMTPIVYGFMTIGEPRRLGREGRTC